MTPDEEDQKPECSCCKNGEAASAIHEMEMVQKYGWYSHYVFGSKTAPNTVNIHTHFLPDKYQHLDLQIVVPVPQKLATCLLWAMVEEIEKGIKLTPGLELGGIIKNYKITFAKAKESGRDVIRAILPDEEGNLHSEDPVFAAQWEGTE